MEQNLKVVITGDVKGLDDAALQAQKTMETLNSKIKQTSKDIAANIQISQGYERAIAELNKELSTGVISQAQYQKALTRLQRDEKETTLETSKLRKELSNLEKQQKELSRATPTLTNGINATGKATANATPTLIEFGRVIQDAPYGIQGVANNIQQLTTNFGYLKQSTGSSKAAFQAVIGSLTGPAGMVVAVSAVTSIMVQYGGQILKALKSTDDLTEATKKYTAEARAEGTQLNILLGIARNESESKEVRQKAIDEINKTYKEYLGNLDLESVKTANVTENVKKLTLALVQRAKIEGLKNAIAEKTADFEEDILDAELRRTDAYKNLNKEVNDAIKSNAFLNQVLGNVKDEKERIKQFIELSNKYEDVRNSSRTAVQAVLEYNNAIKNSKDVNKELEDSLTNLVSVQTRLQTQLFKNQSSIVPEVETEIKPKKTEETKIQVRGELVSLDVPLKPEGIQELSTAIENVKIVMPPVDNSEYLRSLLEAQEMAGIFSEATSASLGAFASSVASAFETGNSVIDAFVGSLVKSFTEIIQAEANALIQKQALAGAEIAVDQAKSTSSAIAAGSQTAAASGPAAAFLLPALIAGAIAVVAAAFGGLGKFAQGGIVGGGKTVGDQIPIFVNSGEMVLTSRQQSNLFDLLNSSISNRSGIESGIIAEQRIRNGDIYLSYKRAERKNKRF